MYDAVRDTHSSRSCFSENTTNFRRGTNMEFILLRENAHAFDIDRCFMTPLQLMPTWRVGLHQ